MLTRRIAVMAAAALLAGSVLVLVHAQGSDDPYGSIADLKLNQPEDA